MAMHQLSEGNNFKVTGNNKNKKTLWHGVSSKTE